MSYYNQPREQTPEEKEVEEQQKIMAEELYIERKKQVKRYIEDAIEIVSANGLPMESVTSVASLFVFEAIRTGIYDVSNSLDKCDFSIANIQIPYTNYEEELHGIDHAISTGLSSLSDDMAKAVSKLKGK